LRSGHRHSGEWISANLCIHGGVPDFNP
jgi:hypothetical protein